MNVKNRRYLIIALSIVFVICLCVIVAGVLGSRYISSNGAGDLISKVSCAGFPDNPNTADTNTQLDQIEQQVIAIRGLQPKNDVTRGFMTPDELRQHVKDNFFKDYTAEDAQTDAHELAVLGLLQPGFDLITFYTDLYSEQIAGFYDQQTKEMYVIKDTHFGGPERMTYAHEYVHALQDQQYDFENGLKFNDETCKNDSERCAAISALVEGDASISESTWYKDDGTKQDCQEITSFYSTFQSPIYDNAPEFMKQDFLFPYLQGKDFVQALIDRGDEKNVDQAFGNPPISTEQILHPEKYPSDTPKEVSLPDLTANLGPGWKEIDHGVMGEWYIYLILAYGIDPATRLKSGDAAKAADGWGGDAYALYFNSDNNQTVLVMQATWDNETEAQEFQKWFIDYSNLRFGQNPQSDQTTWADAGQTSYLAIQDATTTWILAPDEAILSSIKSSLELP